MTSAHASLITHAAATCTRGWLPWLQASSGPHVARGEQHAKAVEPHASVSSSGVPRTPPTDGNTPPLRAGDEARYVRRWLQPRLPELCEAVLRSALGGDMEATRLLLRMAGLERKPDSGKRKTLAKTPPGFAKKALDEFRAR